MFIVNDWKLLFPCQISAAGDALRLPNIGRPDQFVTTILKSKLVTQPYFTLHIYSNLIVIKLIVQCKIGNNTNLIVINYI